MADDSGDLVTVWSGAMERSGEAPGLSAYPPARVLVPERGGPEDPGHASRRNRPPAVEREEDA